MNNYPIIFILSYNSPQKIITLNTLKKIGSKIPYKIVIGTDDPQKEKYKEIHKDNLLIFDKNKVENIDTMDTLQYMKIAMYARVFIENYTSNNHIKEYIVLDDDYNTFCYRYPVNNKLVEIPIQNIDKIFKSFLKFKHPKVHLAFSQNGDYIGGVQNILVRKGFKFKIMNCFFGYDDYNIPFTGTFNDDVNANLLMGLAGHIPLTITGYSLHQEASQSEGNGMAEAYKNFGTYVKSFYSVIINPAGVKLTYMTGAVKGQTKHYRIHHHINKNLCYPKILHEKYKKT